LQTAESVHETEKLKCMYSLFLKKCNGNNFKKRKEKRFHGEKECCQIKKNKTKQFP